MIMLLEYSDSDTQESEDIGGQDTQSSDDNTSNSSNYEDE